MSLTPRIIAPNEFAPIAGASERGSRLCSLVVNALKPIRRVSQVRQYTDEPVPDDVVAQLLELARWTGSSRNTQPWQFIVVRDKETLRSLASLRPNINWAADAPVGIAIVLEGEGTQQSYDEGRLTERLLTGATMLGYGGGVAWYGEPEHEAKAKQRLGIPDSKVAHQIVMIGKPKTKGDPRPYGPKRGRRALAELVSYERWGQRTQK
jgi:nitroreductase